MSNTHETNKSYRCGIVSIVGRPNVGKSTLVNALVDNDLLATSAHPHTTRRQIRAIDNTSEYQIIYVDTPGIHKPRGPLSDRMNDFAYDALSGAELVIAVFDGSSDFGPGDAFLCETLKSSSNLFVVLNKCDTEKKTENIARRALEISQNIPNAQHVFMVSAFTKKNIQLLKREIVQSLEVSPALFDTEITHDMTDEQLVSELLRESLLRHMHDELPQTLGVIVRENKESQGSKREFDAKIVVTKKSHKPMVISKSGTVLKVAGTRARKRAEILLDTPIILTTHVDVDENWQERPEHLEDYFS